MPDLGLKSFDKLYPMMIRKYQDLIVDQNASEADKINSIILKLNALGKLSNDVVRDWNTVYQWAMNDGLNQDVSNKIELMKSNGELDTILNGIFNALTGDMTTLHTTAKDTLVNSINEVDDLAKSNQSQLAQSASLSILKYAQYKVGNDWSNAIIQGINDAISQKKRLIFEPFVTYQTSLISLSGKSGLIMDFNGAILKALDSTEGKCIEIGTCSNITINNLTIDGNNTYYRGISLLDGNTDINLNNIFIKNISPIIQGTPTNINSVALWISLSNNNRIFVNNIKVDTVNNNNNTTVGDSIGSSRAILFDYVNTANGTNCTNVRINGVDIKNILSEDGDGIAFAGNNAEVDIKIKDISLDNCYKRGIKIQGVFGAELDGIRIRQSNRATNMWAGMSIFCSGNSIKNVDMDIYAVKGIEYTPNYNDNNKSRFQHVKITLTNDTQLQGNYVFPIDLLSVSGNMTVSNVNIEDVTTMGPAESIKVRTFTRNLRIKRANLSSYAGNLISMNMEYTPVGNASDGTNQSHKNMILDDIITDTTAFYTSTSTTYDNCVVNNFIAKDGKDPYIYFYPLNTGIQIKASLYKKPSMPTSGSYRKGDYVENTNFAEAGTAGSKYILLGWKRLTTGSAHVLNTDWLECHALTGN